MEGKEVLLKLRRLLCPILQPSRLIGCLPFEAAPRSPNTENTVLRPSRKWLIATVFNLAIHVYSFSRIRGDFLPAGGGKRRLRDALTSIAIFSTMIVATVNLLLNVWRTKKICKCFNDAVQIITDMSDFQGIAFSWAIPATFLWVTSGIIALTLMHEVSIGRYVSLHLLASLYIHIIITLIVDIQYSLLCVLINGAVGMLRSAISTLQLTVTAWQKQDKPCVRPAELVSRLEWIRVCHSALHSLVRRVHSAYDFQLLLSVSLNQASLIITLYDTVVGMIHGSLNANVVLAMTICAARTTSLCVWASVAVYQIRGLVEESATIETAHWTNEAKQQWRLLLNQMDSLKMRFEATGMVTISTDLLLSVAASTTTYFIVLIQFED